ncbi:ArsA family ATPase [Streptomyces lunaelactis]|uniref:ArsA family ATPase n=1 Tax=Streptomyces lunaelactis TaxID=1535768 RepID=UPI0015845769|nr:ArsA family ATPase [Streptomyces lunaelactis]NUK08689.1 ArsA family ATPase [Streptomyces lunaelactis]NUK34515.1 ArsA family ATPase [Streptomyces lunaelactis]NUK40201.1 ArsA family ATPase [Streptomyces lunaelactis]NUK49505.1 ArsA family ATPase [Streptomyces lunaelactis]NUK63764.1 ArsA family ATPase [Streptomyces lunaelactis]
MRTVLVTGLGGAGRTTVAAATALAAARRGKRALFLSAEPGDVLATPVTGLPGAPAEVTAGLWAARIDSAADFRAELLSLQERSATALDLLGAERLEDEELTELPGSEQFALLRALRTAADGGWDVVVVDMPPLRETIALLALPEQLRRYLRRLLPPERQAARALRPMLAQLAGVPMPAQWLYETAGRWEAELAAVQALIEAGTTTLRVVAEPGPAAADALRTARTGFALHGLRVDALLANRMLPPASADTWLATLSAQQEKCLAEWYGQWPPGTSLCEVRHLGRDPRGLADLALLDTGPGCETGRQREERADDIWQQVEDRRAEDGVLLWRLSLPGAVKEDLGLVRRGAELLLTVGPFRRIVPLPSALRRCTVSGAGLTDGVLSVRFTPDPGLWPRTG